MPELPEIANRARECAPRSGGKTISAVLQPKVLNVTAERFAESVRGARILNVTNRGKWLFVETTGGWLLINQGMGGELRLTRASPA